MVKKDAMKLLKGYDLTDFGRKVLIATLSIKRGSVKSTGR